MISLLGWILLAFVLGVLVGRARWRWPKIPGRVPRETVEAGPPLVPDDEAVTRLREVPGFDQMSRVQQQQVMRDLKQRFLTMRGRAG